MRLCIFLLFITQVFGAQAKVSTLELSNLARKQASRVSEFAYIRKAAEEIGVKVYLFGGSAAAYAHYVRWYIELQNGSENHQPERFDFDYTNIYRGNQDLDLVVDGTAEQAEEFQQILKSKYAHIVGEKHDWEVRLLREQIDDKLPLLDDPDFKNQHTDTNSTGMLDLTASKKDPIFRDLLDWENEESQFLKDVAAARITYLFSENHETTSRFKDGKNPPIFSAVRYLAKLTQYEVKGTKKDLEVIKKIIQDTNFNTLSLYVQRKLEEFALKALLNAPNSEYAWNLLESLDLRKKLIKMDQNQTQNKNTLSWWLNKEPLRSRPFGKTGKTAKELFGDKEIIISHETNSFQAYENITRSSKGEANAFISRDGVEGEVAAMGDGFYTMIGLKGAAGTGLTIRFKLHPDARENKDFLVRGDILVITNKKALTLIQENINIGVIDFINLLTENNIGENDQGLKEKLLRKFKRLPPSSPEIKKSYLFFKKRIDFLTKGLSPKYQFKFPALKDFNIEYLIQFATELFPKYIDEVYDFAVMDPELYKHWLNNKEVVDEIFRLNLESTMKLIITEVLSEERAPEVFSYLIEQIINTQNKDLIYELVSGVFPLPHWKNHLHLLEKVLEMPDQEIGDIILFVLKQAPHSAEYPQLFSKIINLNYSYLEDRIIGALSEKHWAEHPQLISELVKTDFSNTLLIKYILVKKHWAQHPDLFIEILKTEDLTYEVLEHALNLPHWNTAHEVLDYIITHGDLYSYEALIKFVFNQAHWSHRPELFIKFIHKIQKHDALTLKTLNLLNLAHWNQSPELVMAFIGMNNKLLNNRIALSYPDNWWQTYPEIIMTLLQGKSLSEETIKQLFKKRSWKDHSEIKAFFEGKTVNYKNLKAIKTSFVNWQKEQKNSAILSCQQLL